MMKHSSKTFRIFISSTFSDLEEERNTLQKVVFPKLKKFCAERGYQFQAIDLRWGIRAEAAYNQKVIKACFEEIERCQKITPRPNFLVILGNRYGWQPLPFKIPKDEFDEIIKHLSNNEKEGKTQIKLLNTWYRRDDNAIPPIYLLQPRKRKYKKEKNWNKIKDKIQKILRNEIIKIGLKNNQLIKYTKSATEQEIIKGVLDAKENHDNIFCFFRNFSTPLEPRMGSFIDLDENNELDREAYERCNHLKSKLRSTLPKKAIYDYEIQWQDFNERKEYLIAMCDFFYNSLSKVIIKEIETLREIDALDNEISEHKKFCKERQKVFLGRINELKKIDTYLKNSNNKPLVIYGESGSGKSALISKAITELKDNTGNSELIFRFIGITPNSSNIRDLLKNMCIQICRIYDSDDGMVPDTYKGLVPAFYNYLSLANDQKPLIIFIDALDQLLIIDETLNLDWLPQILPKHVKIIISTTHGKFLQILRDKIPSENFIEPKLLKLEECKEILNIWFDKAKRTLSVYQWNKIISKFKKCRLPLFLKLAFEEARLWKSYTKKRKIKLSKNINKIIYKNIFKRLSLNSNHGKELVSYSLGYLAAAKNGLAEDEIINILSSNSEVYRDFLRRAKHEPPEKKIPIVIWSRFYFDLEPYLTIRIIDGTRVFSFFHDQFKRVIKNFYISSKQHRKNHLFLAKFFEKQDLNQRIISELPYNLVNSLPSMFKNTEKKDESSIVNRAVECLFVVCKHSREDLVKHIQEVKPLCNWLFKMRKYKEVIAYVEGMTEEIEKQNYWSPLENINNLGMKSADLLDQKNKKLIFIYNLARTLLHRGDYKKAIKICKEILNDIHDNNKLKADILWHIGTTIRYSGKPNKVFEYVKAAEKIACSIKDENILIKSLITKGITEHGRGNFKKALKHYNRSYRIFKSTEHESKGNDNAPDKNLIPSSKFEIMGMLSIRGSLGYNTKDYALAQKSWQKWLEMAESECAERDIKNAKSKLSLIKKDIDIGDKKQIFKDLLDEYILNGERISAITAYGELAEIYIFNDEIKDAIALCNEALKFSSKINNLHAKSAKNYIKGLLFIANGNLKRARKYLDKSEILFAKWTSPYRFWVSNTIKRLDIE